MYRKLTPEEHEKYSYIPSEDRMRFLTNRDGEARTPDKRDVIESYLDDVGCMLRIMREVTYHREDLGLEIVLTKAIDDLDKAHAILEFLKAKDFEREE